MAHHKLNSLFHSTSNYYQYFLKKFMDLFHFLNNSFTFYKYKFCTTKANIAVIAIAINIKLCTLKIY